MQQNKTEANLDTSSKKDLTTRQQRDKFIQDVFVDGKEKHPDILNTETEHLESFDKTWRYEKDKPGYKSFCNEIETLMQEGILTEEGFFFLISFAAVYRSHEAQRVFSKDDEIYHLHGLHAAIIAAKTLRALPRNNVIVELAPIIILGAMMHDLGGSMLATKTHHASAATESLDQVFEKARELINISLPKNIQKDATAQIHQSAYHQFMNNDYLVKELKRGLIDFMKITDYGEKPGKKKSYKEVPAYFDFDGNFWFNPEIISLQKLIIIWADLSAVSSPDYLEAVNSLMTKASLRDTGRPTGLLGLMVLTVNELAKRVDVSPQDIIPSTIKDKLYGILTHIHGYDYGEAGRPVIPFLMSPDEKKRKQFTKRSDFQAFACDQLGLDPGYHGEDPYGVIDAT